MKAKFSLFHQHTCDQQCGMIFQQTDLDKLEKQDIGSFTDTIAEVLQNRLVQLPLLEQILIHHPDAIRELTDPNGVLVLFYQHYFFSTLEMLLTVNALGVPRDQIFCLGKNYSFSPEVHEKMLEMGFKSYGAQEVKVPGTFYDESQAASLTLLEDASKLCRERKLHTVIVVTDGGMMLSLVSKFNWGGAKLGGVIQTTRGWYEWFDHGHYDQYLPVVDVSYSAAKLGLEYLFVTNGIIESVIRNLTKYQAELGVIKVCGIIGLGNLGSQVAMALHKCFSDWRFIAFDPKNTEGTKTVTLEPGCAVTLTDMETVLQQSDLIAGCSGSDSLASYQHLAQNLVQGRYGKKTMFSVSSGDIEFLTVLRAGCAANGWHVTKENEPFSVLKNIVHVAHNGAAIYMMRGGYPINLRTDGLEPKGFQLTRALLCSATIQAIKLVTEGDEVNRNVRTIQDNCYALDADWQLEITRNFFNVMNADYRYFSAETEQNFSDSQWIAEHSKNQAYLSGRRALA